MTEKVCDSHHGHILKLRGHRLYLRAKFTHDVLKEMRFEFRNFEKTKKLAILDHCLCRLVPCISNKLATFV